MDLLIKQKDKIENDLNNLKSQESDAEYKLTLLTTEIKNKVSRHNELIKSMSELRKEYKNKQEIFKELKHLMKIYKEEQKQSLLKEYALEIENITKAINSIEFEFKINIFKKFDQIKGINTSLFPNLEKKKRKFFEENKYQLRLNIIEKIKCCMSEKEKISDLIFYINFLLKFEIYFNEGVFIDFLYKIIEKKFEYHFMSDRESNRLDKPEWIFEFLLRKYEELEYLYKIYDDCSRTINQKNTDLKMECSSGRMSEFKDLINMSQSLVYLKINELSKIQSVQKMNLVWHFATEFIKFKKNVEDLYSLRLNTSEMGYLLSKVQSSFLKTELTRIHELKYVQWFREYKDLCKKSMIYKSSFGELDKDFKMEDLIESIILHAKTFLDNLRFINREEIKIICYIFSELEELKAFLSETEIDIRFDGKHPGIDDLTTKSLSIITKFNSNVLKLIKELALNDVSSILKRIIYFNYVTTEVKRTVIIELNKVMHDYRQCVYFESIEKTVAERTDNFILEEILLKIVFTSEEYLEFRSFYKNIKKCFSEFEWKADAGCKAVDALFEGRSMPGHIYKTVKSLYNKN